MDKKKVANDNVTNIFLNGKTPTQQAYSALWSKLIDRIRQDHEAHDSNTEVTS